MALITCPECSREISDKAESCPNCGSPITKNALPTVTCLECESVYPINKLKCPNCSYGNHSYKYINMPEPKATVSEIVNKKTTQPVATELDAAIICPRCKAKNAYHASGKGFGLGKAAVGGLLLGPIGLLGGLIGSKKLVVQCINCGNKWSP